MKGTTVRRRGMTILEMLVGTAVLVTLGAIILPAFGLARLCDKSSGDMCNLRQLTLAAQVYALDADQVLPPATQAANPADLCSENATWRQSILPYVRDWTLFVSPTLGSGAPCPVGSPLRLTGHYGMQVFIAGDGILGLESNLNLSSLQIASATLLLGPNRDSASTVSPLPGNCDLTGTARGAVRSLDGRTNWGFADGHASSLRDSELYGAECAPWKLTKPSAYFQ